MSIHERSYQLDPNHKLTQPTIYHKCKLKKARKVSAVALINSHRQC